MQQKKSVPRGIRNKNPLNIRIGNTWLGEVQQPTDLEFEQFVSMEYGCRAAFVLLRRYIRRFGRNTIRKIISTWAPSSENNTAKYIEKVSKATGIGADDVIAYEDFKTMVKIVCAMAYVENGEEIDQSIVERGYKLA